MVSTWNFLDRLNIFGDIFAEFHQLSPKNKNLKQFNESNKIEDKITL